MPQVTDFIDDTPTNEPPTYKPPKVEAVDVKALPDKEPRRPWQRENSETLDQLVEIWQNPESILAQPHIDRYVPDQIQELTVSVLKTARQAEQRLVSESQRRSVYKILQRLMKIADFK